MKRVMWIAILLALIFILMTALPVEAGDEYPNGIQVFHVEDHICVLFASGELECFCPCEECKEVVYTEEPEEKDKPKPKPEPTPEPKPKPTKKAKCNAGKGNGSEGSPDCDPGNSGGNNNAGD